MKRRRDTILDEYLALSFREAEAGYVAEFDVDKIIEGAKAKRRAGALAMLGGRRIHRTS